MYSQDMKDLVSKLLVKDETKRPQAIEILRMPYVQRSMMAFIQNQGQNVNSQFHLLSAPKSIQPANVNKLKQKDESQLTAQDKMKLRKEKRDLEQFEQLKLAASAANQNFAVGRKLQEFHQQSSVPMGTIR